MLTLETLSGKIDSQTMFGNDAPLVVDMGCGRGKFLADQAALEPHKNFVGIEKSRKFSRIAAERVARRGLENCRVVCAYVEPLLEKHLRGPVVSEYHVLFPDPWPKRRHHRRRTLQTGTVRAMAATLQPGGLFRFVTDVPELFDFARAQIGAVSELEPLPLEGQDEALFAYSSYHQRFVEEERPIYSYVWKRKED